MICGKATRKGTPCQCELKAGLCPTHDCDLSRRNRKVTRAFRNSDPEGFENQRRAAGKKGYARTLELYGREYVEGKARDFRLMHPSPYEEKMATVLERLGILYKREVEVIPHLFVDFLIDDTAIEVNDHRKDSRRAEFTNRKLLRLAEAGINTLVIPLKDVFEPSGFFREIF